MTALAPDKKVFRDFDSDYERDFDDLVWGRRAGHMGHHEYSNDSMGLWNNFIDQHSSQYYIPGSEIELIEKAAKVSARLLGNQPITLVSRGCGTKFFEKERRLLQHFENVVGLVYLDRSDAALKQSMEEGRSLLPNAWHKSIRCDLYDSGLRYPIEGTEVGVMFGMTLLNIEGFPTSSAPKDAYVRNLSSINAQMHKGAHFIVTADHNQDRRSVEQAYADQSEFAKDMLRRTESINPAAVDFVVKFHRNSQILAHGFHFRRDETLLCRSGVKPISAGTTLWFNNSVKPEINKTQSWNMASGYTYARNDIIMDDQSRLGWHHLIK